MTSGDRTENQRPLFDIGRNCWRVETADKYEMVVDGAAYFTALREALIKARDQVLLIGWDFDLEIEMCPGESNADGLAPDGYPNTVKDFLEALVKAQPDLDLYILRWSGSAIVAPGRLVPAMRLRFGGPDQIRLALDGRHPVSACHHQKIVVVDDALAFCGGIDVTDARWDTPDHTPEDPRRVLRDGSPASPWHDLASAVTGPAAQALGDLARMRWQRSTGEELKVPKPTRDDHWPPSLNVACRNVDITISRTEPPEADQLLINEIEEMIMDQIATATSVIYMESQYFASDEVAQALSLRLREKNGPDVIVINPVAALQVVEEEAMHVTRTRLTKALRSVDHEGRLRIAAPVNAAEDPIYVHAKVCITDDRALRIGSSNINRRSLGFDTECDLTVEGKTASARRAIEGLRNRLLAEHLGCDSAELEATIAETGRVRFALDALNPSSGRGLKFLELGKDRGIGAFLADTRLLDPRFEKGASARPRISGRHIGLGAVVLAVLALIFAAFAS